MKRRFRFRQTLKWTGTLASMVLVLIYCTSAMWYISYYDSWGKTGGISVWLGRGVFEASEFEGWNTRPLNHIIPGWNLAEIYPPRLDFSAAPSVQWSPNRGATIPLWLPMIIVLALTLFAWWVDRRPPKPGFCANCGYNLTGMTSVRCPECGTTAVHGEECRPALRRS